MNTFVNGLKQIPDSSTDNGAETFASSLDACVDFFFAVGSSRKSPNEAVGLFRKAQKQNSVIAHRIALWARDVRGGAGEREVFRHLLADMTPEMQINLIEKVVELGRFDDLKILVLSRDEKVSSAAAEFWKKTVLSSDPEQQFMRSLAGKWADRKGPAAIVLRKLWGMSPKQFRKTIVSATNVVEVFMCAGKWDDIDFEKVPSIAAARYNAAFYKNAMISYMAYKNRLVKGEAKINASVIFPHDIIRTLNSTMCDLDVVGAQWKALPNYLQNASDILVMSDVSGSMNCAVSGSITAMDISISLGLYVSERQVGPFKDVVLTFSKVPQIHFIKGDTIVDKIQSLSMAHWEMNTDLNAAFEVILKVAKENNVPAKDMPKILLVISDMSFDKATHNHHGKVTNFQAAQRMFSEAGYKIPTIIFWNLNSHSGNIPVRFDEEGVALVSGFSPAILKSILAVEEISPIKIMLETCMAPRYYIEGLDLQLSPCHL